MSEASAVAGLAAIMNSPGRHGATSQAPDQQLTLAAAATKRPRDEDNAGGPSAPKSADRATEYQLRGDTSSGSAQGLSTGLGMGPAGASATEAPAAAAPQSAMYGVPAALAQAQGSMAGALARAAATHSMAAAQPSGPLATMGAGATPGSVVVGSGYPGVPAEFMYAAMDPSQMYGAASGVPGAGGAVPYQMAMAMPGYSYAAAVPFTAQAFAGAGGVAASGYPTVSTGPSPYVEATAFPGGAAPASDPSNGPFPLLSSADLYGGAAAAAAAAAAGGGSGSGSPTYADGAGSLDADDDSGPSGRTGADQQKRDKRSRREKLRREELREWFADLNTLLGVSPMQTNKARSVKLAIAGIKQLRSQVEVLKGEVRRVNEEKAALAMYLGSLGATPEGSSTGDKRTQSAATSATHPLTVKVGAPAVAGVTVKAPSSPPTETSPPRPVSQASSASGASAVSVA